MVSFVMVTLRKKSAPQLYSPYCSSTAGFLLYKRDSLERICMSVDFVFLGEAIGNCLTFWDGTSSVGSKGFASAGCLPLQYIYIYSSTKAMYKRASYGDATSQGSSKSHTSRFSPTRFSRRAATTSPTPLSAATPSVPPPSCRGPVGCPC